MDLDDAEALREPAIYPDETSGSAYETNSEAEGSSSHDGQAVTARSSRASSVKSRSKKTKSKRHVMAEDEELSGEEGKSAAADRASITPSTHRQSFEDAEEWASNFQAPASPSAIKDPPRSAAGSRAKRKAHKPANEIRAKRLKSYYNNDYRELLNIDIEDTAAGRIQGDQYPLQASQIGSSIWTASEKDLFFTALARLGRDSVRGIAARIGSKSELQVQEYIQLLHQGINERRLREGRLLAPTDMPAAIQISDECSGVLERAGDALAIRQERAEEKIEKTKWGDSWLLTKDSSRFLEKRRKEEGGGETLEEVLPAVNLFHLKRWLELSEKVFMNPAAPYEDDNWQALAEAGETPAIRATAFADFHSLAVNITKRLVSTIFYCTMSRLRARESNKVKHAEVGPSDVEAAVNILGMKSNSNAFWIGSARRCRLRVTDDGPEVDENDDEEEDAEADENQEGQFMAYNDVEAALSSSGLPWSRSTSRQVLSRPPSCSSANSDLPLSSSSSLDISPSDPSVVDCSSSSAENSDSSSSPNSSTQFHFSTRRHVVKLKKKAARKAAEKAQEEYTEAFDMQASQLEEAHLWELLKQDPPFEVEKVESLEKFEIGMGKWKRGATDGNVREWVGFWSEWETMETPVTEQEFEKNRKVSRKMKRQVEEVQEGFGSSDEASSYKSGVSQDAERESVVENVQLIERSIEVEDNLQQEDEDANAGTPEHASQLYEDDDEISIKIE
jgi:RNA polymerase I-specific transcription initiation factor RRN5